MISDKHRATVAATNQREIFVAAKAAHLDARPVDEQTIAHHLDRSQANALFIRVHGHRVRSDRRMNAEPVEMRRARSHKRGLGTSISRRARLSLPTGAGRSISGVIEECEACGDEFRRRIRRNTHHERGFCGICRDATWAEEGYTHAEAGQAFGGSCTFAPTAGCRRKGKSQTKTKEATWSHGTPSASRWHVQHSVGHPHVPRLAGACHHAGMVWRQLERKVASFMPASQMTIYEDFRFVVHGSKAQDAAVSLVQPQGWIDVALIECWTKEMIKFGICSFHDAGTAIGTRLQW